MKGPDDGVITIAMTAFASSALTLALILGLGSSASSANSRMAQQCQRLGDAEYGCVQYTAWAENENTCSCALPSGRRIRFEREDLR